MIHKLFCYNKYCSPEEEKEARLDEPTNTTAPSTPATLSSPTHAPAPAPVPAHSPTRAPDDSTSALVELVISSALPIVRKAVSKKLIESKSVLHNEQLVEEFDEFQEEENLPIGEIEIKIEDVLIMDSQSVKKDMLVAPDFAWPEKDRIDDLDDLMAATPGSTARRKMLVLDFVGFECMLPLAKGIEITIPMEVPFVFKGGVEVGSGGDIEQTFVRLEVPRLRIWFVTETKKLYVAFLGKPELTPNLNVNLDRGKGDFLSFSLAEQGNLDDLVEEVLCGFGPKGFAEVTQKQANGQEKITAKVNWAGAALGRTISSIAQKVMGRTGKGNIPLEIDLSDTIKSVVDIALGKPRPIEVIKAQMTTLEKELERAKAMSNEEGETPSLTESSEGSTNSA